MTDNQKSLSAGPTNDNTKKTHIKLVRRKQPTDQIEISDLVDPELMKQALRDPRMQNILDVGPYIPLIDEYMRLTGGKIECETTDGTTDK